MGINVGIIVDNDLNSDNRVLKEIESLKNSGYIIHVLCFAFAGKSYIEIPGVEITRIKIRKRIKDILFFFLNLIPIYEFLWSSEISRFIRTGNIDILHVNDLYMSKASSEGIRKSGRKVKMILDLHENFPYSITTYNWTKGFFRSMLSQPARWKRKEKKYLAYADGIIVLSESYRDRLTGLYPGIKETPFAIHPNVPDIKSFYSARGKDGIININKEAPLLFYYGVIAERRGIFDALDVFADILKSGIKAGFLIIGPVDKMDQKRFKSIITSRELADQVTYIPWIDHGSLAYYLDISDICIAPFLKNPQHESGVANKIYEYMLGKKPLVVSDCEPQKRLVEETNCGLVYSTREEFREALIRLINDSELRKTLGESGYKAIISSYNLEKAERNLADFYKIFNPGELNRIKR